MFFIVRNSILDRIEAKMDRDSGGISRAHGMKMEKRGKKESQPERRKIP